MKCANSLYFTHHGISTVVLFDRSHPDFKLCYGIEAPTPTQSTCLYYDHDNEASKCGIVAAVLGTKSVARVRGF